MDDRVLLGTTVEECKCGRRSSDTGNIKPERFKVCEFKEENVDDQKDIYYRLSFSFSHCRGRSEGMLALGMTDQMGDKCWTGQVFNLYLSKHFKRANRESTLVQFQSERSGRTQKRTSGFRRLNCSRIDWRTVEVEEVSKMPPDSKSGAFLRKNRFAGRGMSKPKRKCRLYSVDYLKYGFIPSHGNRQHPEKVDKDVSYFQALRDKRNKQPRISVLIAKTGYAHTIGEATVNSGRKGGSRTIVCKGVEKKIPLTNTVSVATDGAPSTSGVYRGFIAFMKQEVPDVWAVHCVIHKQHLVAKKLSERLNCSLRIFRKMCGENDKSNCLSRSYGLFGTVLNFFEEHDVSLCEDVKKSKNDIAYMADLYSKFNEMNLQLQEVGNVQE
uniref:DUF4371 domain-containing protein n=1 Tax=Trichuris muris TaxID=70415 RepID=A0A5S6R1M9_TRIMR